MIPPNKNQAATLNREGQSVMPRNGEERRLFEIWVSILGQQSFGVTSHFFEIGGGSLAAVQVIGCVDSEFKVSLPPTQLYHTPTIEGLAQLLREQSIHPLASHWEAIYNLRRGTLGKSLFCFPGSGGNVSEYFDLADSLPREWGLDVVLYPALERDDPPRSMQDLASLCVAAIKAAQPAGPYLLGGHSFGGTVAYEVGQQLRARGDAVSMLALWEADFAPHGGFREFASMGVLSRIREVTLPRKMKWAYILRQCLAIVPRYLGKRSARPDSAETIKVTVVDHVFRFQMAAAELHRNYCVRPFDGHLSIFVGADSAQKEDLSSWTRLAGRGVEVHTIPGDHSSLLRKPNVSVLAARLETCLAKQSGDGVNS